MKTIFLCFFCLFTIGCTHQSSQENCVEIGSADAICVSTDTLGKTVRMNMLHGHYTTESEEVFAIVLNPQKLPLSYGRRWILERWENNQWVTIPSSLSARNTRMAISPRFATRTFLNCFIVFFLSFFIGLQLAFFSLIPRAITT